MTILMLSMLFGIFRASHGAGKIHRIVAILLMTFFTFLYLNLTLFCTCFVFIGLIIGLSPGWGKYQSATGSPYYPDQKEIWFIDIITNKIYKLQNGVLAGVVGMSLRWYIFFIPLFILFLKTHLALPLLFVGPIYALYNVYPSWFLIEFLSGALLGALVALI